MFLGCFARVGVSGISAGLGIAPVVQNCLVRSAPRISTGDCRARAPTRGVTFLGRVSLLHGVRVRRFLRRTQGLRLRRRGGLLTPVVTVLGQGLLGGCGLSIQGRPPHIAFPASGVVAPHNRLSGGLQEALRVESRFLANGAVHGGVSV